MTISLGRSQWSGTQYNYIKSFSSRSDYFRYLFYETKTGT